MLETVDLDATLPKPEFKKSYETLSLRLGQLQRDIRAAKLPVLIVFEGWLASGVGTAIGRLLEPLDPRGYLSLGFDAPSKTERLYPPMWRYWNAIPARGQIVIYDGSWYVDALSKPRKPKEALFERIRVFERQLADDSAILVKFWLHISKEEQAKRFKKLKSDPALAWKVTKEDWRRNSKYELHAHMVEDMLRETSTSYAPWTVVPSHDQRYTCITIAETVAAALENALAKQALPKPALPAPRPRAVHRTSPLDRVNLSLQVTRDQYEKALSKYQKELQRLEHLIYPLRIPVVVMYEGWDASGKGGNIRRLISGLDHRGFEVTPIAAPEGDERAHHYLWRFWRRLPKGGHITIFDRSWYGRVLVERVEGFASPAEWQRAYQEINEFEANLTAHGSVLVKFWMHISKEEQLKRFTLRQKTPYKQWKITDEDWRNREKWDAYHQAVSDMIERTSTPDAPWTIIEGNDKLHARLKALKTVTAAIQRAVHHAPKGKGINGHS